MACIGYLWLSIVEQIPTQVLSLVSYHSVLMFLLYIHIVH